MTQILGDAALHHIQRARNKAHRSHNPRMPLYNDSEDLMPTVTLNAGTVHYENAGPPDGRPVVFIHGYSMGSSLWRPLSEPRPGAGAR